MIGRSRRGAITKESIAWTMLAVTALERGLYISRQNIGSTLPCRPNMSVWT